MTELTNNPDNQRFFFGSDNKDGHLLPALKKSLGTAIEIDLAVSFVMESGVKLIINELKQAVKRGAKIRILCGSYLQITDPVALSILYNELPPESEIWLYSEEKRSFHPKSYIFRYLDGSKEAFVGSSNLSKSALTNGIEWNYLVRQSDDPENFARIRSEFNKLQQLAVRVNEQVLEDYSSNWVKPSILYRTESNAQDDSTVIPVPRGAQIEALYALEKSRSNGNRKALIHAATGVGKTYLAAFDSKNYSKILFIAHRQEILKQAAESFSKVRPGSSIGFLDQNHHEVNSDILMASVFTLSSDRFLKSEAFSPTEFDYIVIDEFHHAAADSYQKILSYFKPKFLLGLTATPDRLDGKSVYALCDFNVPYSIDLKTSINRGLLVPFRYYALFDSVDYSALRKQNGRFVRGDLEQIYSDRLSRMESIFRNYKKHQSKQAIGFCASKKHALMMARYFKYKGIPSTAVYSGSGNETDSMGRSEALEKIRNGDLRIIFTVDLFNEGLDIDSLDMVMFLRLTESPVIFLQQLGRGLRLYPDKKYLTVLDYIGNYDQAFLAPGLLMGATEADLPLTTVAQEQMLPNGCLVDFDLDLIDLFEKIKHSKKSVSERLQLEYKRIRNLLSRPPNQEELFENMDDELLDLILKNNRLNPFRNYLGFLIQMGDVTSDEEKLYYSIAGEFLRMVEQTRMDHVYKAPILLSFINEEENCISSSVNEKQTLRVWKSFFSQNENWRDFQGRSKPISFRDYESMTDADHLSKILGRRHPVESLLKSESRFFVKKSNSLLSLSEDLTSWLDDQLFIKKFKDAINFRVKLYYYKRFKAELDKGSEVH